MKKAAVLTIACLCLGSNVAWPQVLPQDAQRFWAQWRGPDATGVAPFGNPPLAWGEGRNVRWKVEIPGKGSASPVVWDDRVFVLTAIPSDGSAAGATPQPDVAGAPGDGTAGAGVAGRGAGGDHRRAFGRGGRQRGFHSVAPTAVQEFAILAISRDDGSVLWQRTARQEMPHEGVHPTGSWASNSAVTDGIHVYAFFGSRGLYCYDFDGNLKWEKDLGDMTIRLGFGEGASPTLSGDKLIVNWDHEGQSFIVALDKSTGEEIWRSGRDELTSWTTPIVVEHDGRHQVITSATNRVRSYDLDTGELIWEGNGVTMNAIPSPVAADGLVYVTSGFMGNALRAIRLAAASGDINRSGAVIWEHDRDTPYVPSPLLYGDNLYILKSNSPILSSVDAKTGDVNYGPLRLEGLAEVYASPVGAADRVYIVDRDGNAVVLRNGPDFEVLARNSLDDGFDASPAIVDQEIYLRGYRFLYRISEN